MFKIGDRVRMVQTRSTGVVAGELYTSEVDGGERIPIRWGNSGQVTGWSSAFLRPATSRPEEDPDEVRHGQVVRRRGRIYNDVYGTMVIIPEGFTKVDVESSPAGVDG